MTSSNLKDLTKIVETLGIPHIRYHIFICADATKSQPKCCDPQVGLETWEYLKSRLRELKLDQVQVDSTTQEPGCIYRTKANCLRVCQQGPIVLIYPDRVWYHSVSVEVMERIIQEHLLRKTIVEDYVLHQDQQPWG